MIVTCCAFAAYSNGDVAAEGIESALELKLAYAQSTAKIVELELLQGEKGASASPQQAVGQIVQVSVPSFRCTLQQPWSRVR